MKCKGIIKPTDWSLAFSVGFCHQFISIQRFRETDYFSWEEEDKPENGVEKTFYLALCPSNGCSGQKSTWKKSWSTTKYALPCALQGTQVQNSWLMRIRIRQTSKTWSTQERDSIFPGTSLCNNGIKCVQRWGQSSLNGYDGTGDCGDIKGNDTISSI